MSVEKLSAINSIYSKSINLKPANFESNEINLLFEPAQKKKTNGVEVKPSSQKSAKLCKKWRVFFECAGKKPMSQDFFNKVEKAANKINCPMEDLLAIIYIESTFNTKAKKVDAQGNAHYGLIQMDETAFKNAKDKDDNTSFSTYRNGKYSTQLNYGTKYILFRKHEKNLKGKLSGGQVRILILSPKNITNNKSIQKAQKLINDIKKQVEDIYKSQTKTKKAK